MIRHQLSAWFSALALFLAALAAAPAVAIDYVWDAGGDGSSWNDANNWDLNLGTPSTTSDRAFFNTAATINAGLGGTINRLFVTAGLVTLNGSLNFGPNADPNGVVVNLGGSLVVTGSVGGQTRGFASAGNVTINGGLSMFANFPTQSAGTWDITTLTLANNATTIAAWSFVDGANTTITNGFTGATYTFTGSPTFAGGRPDWIFNSGGDGGHIINLGAHTLYGDVLSLGSWPGAGTRHTRLNSTGGTLDLNVLNVLADSGGTGNFINVDNGTVLIQGTSGLVWNNQSDENTQFDVATGTTVRIDPTGTGSSVSVDTGSTNLGTAGFANNFGFNNLTLGAGDTVTLTGTQNVGGSAANALYVAGTLRGLDGATLNLSTREAFVDGALEIGSSPGEFTVSNGNLTLTNNAEAHFEINGPLAGVDYDQLVFTGNGTLTLGGATLDLDINNAANGLYFLVDNQSANAISGIFAGLADGASIDTGNPDVVAFISYTADIGSGQFTGGNDIAIQLFAVPEPTTWMLVALGAAGLAWRTRRRKQS